MTDDLCTPGMFQPPKPEPIVPRRPRFEFTCTVRRRDRYGQKYTTETPATVLAVNISEATEKLREAFGAKYDDFREFWSHDVLINSAKEVL